MSHLYIVLMMTLIAWGGVFIYLLRLDGRIKELERKREK